MGHRHTPQVQRGHGSVYRANDGTPQTIEKSLIPYGTAVPVNVESVGDCRFSAGRPPSFGVRVALFALRLYKAYLSVLIAGSCRFEPTCSQYAYRAIESFGVPRGIWLGVKRLLCCHPFSRKFGYDPVPERLPQNDEPSRTNHAAAGHASGRSAPIKDGIRL